ncbi:hypothetical protein EC9_16670 [Rosistilla ulvae]|uniref:Uncharacterized protein n=1 Tax=Rosistilla ulvae TaxID=1930277 RepID=A0A517LXY2_9BACT|nr:hypothetical protein [Rosistilla ulvae]QDS87488.1 hypothetical protein EC9_16670 [Rosistilla ulvae]
MAKFYVSCGSQTLIISAPTAEFAAMRLMDEAMAAHAWIYDDADLSEQDRRDHLSLEALLHLSSTVRVSECGLGRSDAGQFEVPMLLDQWHRLMTGVSRLFVSAGLEPRRVLPANLENVLYPKSPR